MCLLRENGQEIRFGDDDFRRTYQELSQTRSSAPRALGPRQIAGVKLASFSLRSHRCPMPPLGSTSLLSHGSEKRTGPRLGRPRGLRSCPGKWVRFAQRKEPGSAMEPTWADSPTRLTWVRSSRFPGRLGSFLPARSGGGLLAQARRDEVTRAGRQSNRSRIKILDAKPIGVGVTQLRPLAAHIWGLSGNPEPPYE